VSAKNKTFDPRVKNNGPNWLTKLNYFVNLSTKTQFEQPHEILFQTGKVTQKN
jgi:hypothetical protein